MSDKNSCYQHISYTQTICNFGIFGIALLFPGFLSDFWDFIDFKDFSWIFKTRKSIIVSLKKADLKSKRNPENPIKIHEIP